MDGSKNGTCGVSEMKTNKKIKSTISRLKSQGLSYANIGIKLDLNKAAVYQIHKGQWVPKFPEVQLRILNRITELKL